MNGTIAPGKIKVVFNQGVGRGKASRLIKSYGLRVIQFERVGFKPGFTVQVDVGKENDWKKTFEAIDLVRYTEPIIE